MQHFLPFETIAMPSTNLATGLQKVIQPIHVAHSIALKGQLQAGEMQLLLVDVLEHELDRWRAETFITILRIQKFTLMMK